MRVRKFALPRNGLVDQPTFVASGLTRSTLPFSDARFCGFVPYAASPVPTNNERSGPNRNRQPPCRPDVASMPVTTSYTCAAVVTPASSCHAATFTEFGWPPIGESAVVPWHVYTLWCVAKPGATANPIIPVSLAAQKSAPPLVSCTGVPDLRAYSPEPRCVNSMVLSGSQATSHGMSRPPTTGVTVSVGPPAGGGGGGAHPAATSVP